MCVRVCCIDGVAEKRRARSPRAQHSRYGGQKACRGAAQGRAEGTSTRIVAAEEPGEQRVAREKRARVRRRRAEAGEKRRVNQRQWATMARGAVRGGDGGKGREEPTRGGYGRERRTREDGGNLSVTRRAERQRTSARQRLCAT